MATQFPIPITTSGKGAVGELAACAWLVGLGYEVFRNVAYHGPADIVVWRVETNEVHFIDVKTVAADTIYRRPNGNLSIPLGRKSPSGIHRLLVVGGEAIGFFRAAEGGAEFYWPLSCEELLPTLAAAPSYQESGLRARRKSLGKR
jgi:hypothetical protein